MSKNRLTGMGECMIELSSLDGVTFKKSFAGDVMNTLYYARKALDETWSTSLYSGLGTEERSFSYWRDTSAARLLASDKDRVRQVIGEATALYLSGITMAMRLWSVTKVQILWSSSKTVAPRWSPRVMGR